MKAKLFIFFYISFFVFQAQTPSNDPSWVLDGALSDEFNTIDASKWNVLNDFDHYGERVVYTSRPQNVYIESGMLVLEMLEDNYVCPTIGQWNCSHSNYTYSSGWVESKSNFQYGFIEASMKIPHQNGFWPAFWTVPGSGITSQNAAEIDIFEMIGHYSAQIMGTNVHLRYPPSGATGAIQCPNNVPGGVSDEWYFPGYTDCYGQYVPISDYSAGFHKYAIEWTPKKIVWYFDDVAVRTLDNPGVVDPVKIILSFGMQTGYTPTSPLPQSKMYIDYIHFYHLNTDCNSLLNSCSYDLSTYDNKVKNQIILGGSGCSNVAPTSPSTFLRASEGITLNESFEVPLGAEFMADANGLCSTAIATGCSYIFNPCNYNFSGYNSADIKKQIALGGGSCSAVLSSGINISLKANDFILLSSGFIANAGSVAEMIIVPCQ